MSISCYAKIIYGVIVDDTIKQVTVIKYDENTGKPYEAVIDECNFLFRESGQVFSDELRDELDDYLHRVDDDTLVFGVVFRETGDGMTGDNNLVEIPYLEFDKIMKKYDVLAIKNNILSDFPKLYLVQQV